MRNRQIMKKVFVLFLTICMMVGMSPTSKATAKKVEESVEVVVKTTLLPNGTIAVERVNDLMNKNAPSCGEGFTQVISNFSDGSATSWCVQGFAAYVSGTRSCAYCPWDIQ